MRKGDRDTTMANYQELQQVQAFARIDGAVVALLWTLSFACLVGFFHEPASLYGIGWFALGAFSLILAAMRLRKFRDGVLEGKISFARAFGFSILTYLYAALLFAVAQFLYFQYMDNGFLVSQYSLQASSPQIQEMMKLYGLTEQDIRFALENIAALRPIDIALQFFSTNLMLGVFVSLPMALVMKK